MAIKGATTNPYRGIKSFASDVLAGRGKTTGGSRYLDSARPRDLLSRTSAQIASSISPFKPGMKIGSALSRSDLPNKIMGLRASFAASDGAGDGGPSPSDTLPIAGRGKQKNGEPPAPAVAAVVLPPRVVAPVRVAKVTWNSGRCSATLDKLQQFSIGRERDNDCQIADASVSRQHARIFIRDNRWFIADSSSKNGTAIIRGGFKIPVRSEEFLMDGDRIEFGKKDDCYLQFSIEGARADGAAPAPAPVGGEARDKASSVEIIEGKK